MREGVGEVGREGVRKGGIEGGSEEYEIIGGKRRYIYIHVALPHTVVYKYLTPYAKINSYCKLQNT